MASLPSREWADTVTAAINDDEYFERIAAEFDATILFEFGDDHYAFRLEDGRIADVHPRPQFVSWDFAIRAPVETWHTFLSASPPPFYNDLRSAWLQHDIEIEGDLQTAIQYWREVKYLVNTFGEVAG